jgi:hypothetical protein
MPAGNFSDVLNLRPSDGGVDADGPLDAGAHVLEICVWIVQRQPGNGNDAAATEMTTDPSGRAGFFEDPLTQTADRKWKLPVKHIEASTPLVNGPAFAMALALIEDGSGQRKGQLWAQSVVLM